MDLIGLNKPNQKFNTKGAFSSFQEQRRAKDQADIHEYDTLNIYETPYGKDQKLQKYSSKELVNTGKTEAKQKVLIFILVMIAVAVATSITYLVTYMTLMNKDKETHVAFSVYDSSVIGNKTSSMQKIIFTTILFNEGEAYNKTNGTFVAPLSGLYQFNAQICVMPGRTADYELMVEGKPFASGEFKTSSADDAKCTSFSAVAPVLSKQKVWVKSHNLHQFDNDWNAFSGILIYKT